jgi:hypothetical protein
MNGPRQVFLHETNRNRSHASFWEATNIACKACHIENGFTGNDGGKKLQFSADTDKNDWQKFRSNDCTANKSHNIAPQNNVGNIIRKIGESIEGIMYAFAAPLILIGSLAGCSTKNKENEFNITPEILKNAKSMSQEETLPEQDQKAAKEILGRFGISPQPEDFTYSRIKNFNSLPKYDRVNPKTAADEQPSYLNENPAGAIQYNPKENLVKAFIFTDALLEESASLGVNLGRLERYVALNEAGPKSLNLQMWKNITEHKNFVDGKKQELIGEAICVKIDPQLAYSFALKNIFVPVAMKDDTVEHYSDLVAAAIKSSQAVLDNHAIVSNHTVEGKFENIAREHFRSQVLNGVTEFSKIRSSLVDMLAAKLNADPAELDKELYNAYAKELDRQAYPDPVPPR